ncbi:hypothetical protein RVR_4410 [Actinacidiphila reveromycinica]|uniref:Uncharacterized protein n=1 Tax=Actinacidiphila reveromycinica TaxID=659352 RepID=A0A7U3UT56_9ACTN|nr:hypothetical protein [Streptomyces sp. SN-593]BBA98279.1 hypothetical protein RVR_4410 [Streptomyces sp. SN-593]
MLSPGLLTEWTRQVLEAAHRGDEDLVDDVTGRIAERADVLDLLAFCRVVAAEAMRALLVLYRAPDAAVGEAWVLDRLGNAEGYPARLFAARLVTAYANRDHDHVTALVAAAAGASRDERAESLRVLVTYAAGLDARAAHRINPTEGTHDE